MKRKLKRAVRGLAATVAALSIAVLCVGRAGSVTPSGVILALLLALITSQAICEVWFIQLDREAGIRMLTGRRNRLKRNWNFDLRN